VSSPEPGNGTRADGTRPVVLVVDDTPDNLAFLSGLLKRDYRVRVANSGEKALRLARMSPPPDLILLDIVMVGMDGYDVCRRLKVDPSTRHIPIIFLTARGTMEDERFGLELGAADYIAKPISPPILMARVRAQLSLKLAADFLRDKNEFLEEEVNRRTREVVTIQEVTILALAGLAETRDTDTGNHLRRTQRFVAALARKMKDHPRFRDYLTPQNIELLYKTAPLHDIGKVGVPDRILLKPGTLTPEEFEIMKQHTVLGWDALEKAERSVGADVAFLKTAKEIALCHQEKWDGTGYPQGLLGEAIPISARLMAVADVYDALTSRRVYKDAYAHEIAVQIIEEGRSRHFDPDLVDGFLEIQEEFREIAVCYPDTAGDLARKADYRAQAVES